MKHSKVWAPAGLRRVRIQEKTKVGEYLVADDLTGVVGLVQMGVLEIHTWNSVFEKVDAPNRIVFDMDPGAEVAWPRVVKAAAVSPPAGIPRPGVLGQDDRGTRPPRRRPADPRADW